MNKYLISICMLCAVFLSACDSDQGQSTTLLSDEIAPTIAFAIPERIRTAQRVDLQATQATIDTSAGPVSLSRNGEQFEGSITVEPGSIFSFTLSIFEVVNGQSIIYATSTGSTNEPVNRSIEIVINTANFNYPDDDGDGASNLREREAGSDHLNSSSTPSNPDGIVPTETMPGVVQFAASAYSVAEATGSLPVTVNRSGGSDGRVSVQYNLQSETAIIGSDFQAASGELVWEDGDTTPKTIEVVVLADTINDGEQTFTAHLFSPTGGVAIGNGFARITLLDSTPPAQRGTIRLVSSSFSVNENAGQVELEVERVNGADGLVTVDFVTTEGTATAEDFTAVTTPATIRWGDGENGIRTIRISITNDAIVEGAESFTVQLSNNLGGALLGTAAATVTITDTTPTPVPGQIGFAQTAYTVSEGESTEVTIERQAGTDGAVSASLTVSTGTADATDFVANNVVLNWDAGDSSSRTISITATQDDVLEPAEAFTLTLQVTEGGATIGNSTATVSIIDATVISPGAISFTSNSATVNEGASVELPVSRSGGTNGLISVTVNAPASGEYNVTPNLLSWADGDSENKIVTFTALADDVTGDNETVIVQLTDASSGATIGNASITVSINNTTEDPGFTGLASDGEWEVCIAPYNTTGPTGFATQLSANEGRIVSCIKACPENFTRDTSFDGWGWNPTDSHSCVITTDAPGTYTKVPIYTPDRERVNTNLNGQRFIRNNSIWGCVTETRPNAEVDYVTDQSITNWYQFLNDGTYYYGISTDGTQPAVLSGPDTWSVAGRVLELGHRNTGYRNTLFNPGDNNLHIHPTTDDRLNCSREDRAVEN